MLSCFGQLGHAIQRPLKCLRQPGRVLHSDADSNKIGLDTKLRSLWAVSYMTSLGSLRLYLLLPIQVPHSAPGWCMGSCLCQSRSCMSAQGGHLRVKLVPKLGPFAVSSRSKKVTASAEE